MNGQNLAKEINIELLKKYPKDRLKEYRLIPVYNREGVVIFLTDSKPPLPIIDELEVYGQATIEVKIVSPQELDQAVNEYLEAPVETVEGMMDDLNNVTEDFNEINLETRVANLEELAQEAPIIRLVNAIITTALKRNASDIHLEPFENKIKLRYRIDGILYENPTPPPKLFPAIVTRIKIMAGLNISERRLPQEGRIRIKVLGRELDIRVSTMATLYGEAVVLRLLDRADVLLDLKNLGFADDVLDKYYDLTQLTHGIILVTGPTGSGKTTTLYATLEYLNSSEKKIITIEDPVEYQLEGINQIQVKPEIDFTFARGLRSILRQDPDIIMIGEIRDLETASIAIQAALTGHLVFATLHTNDAASAIIRLLDMGVEDYLLSATLKGVMAQRLVRILCQNCKKAYLAENSKIDLHTYDYKDRIESKQFFYKTIGCEQCNNLGFVGRVGIYELLSLDNKIGELITNNSSINEIRKAALELGISSLYDDGMEKVEEGITTIDEVLRVTRN